MKGSNRILSLLAMSTLAGSTVAQAEQFGQKRGCGGSDFSTCAASEVRVVGSKVSIGPAISFLNGSRDSAERTVTLSLPAIGPDGEYRRANSENGCAVPSGNPRDCPITVTPEPVSMTLMATGLAAMSGMGLVRRRKRSLQA